MNDLEMTLQSTYYQDYAWSGEEGRGGVAREGRDRLGCRETVPDKSTYSRIYPSICEIILRNLFSIKGRIALQFTVENENMIKSLHFRAQTLCTAVQP